MSVLYLRLLIYTSFVPLIAVTVIIYLYFLLFLLSFDNGIMVKGKHGKVSPACLWNHLSKPLYSSQFSFFHSVIISVSQTKTSRLDVCNSFLDELFFILTNLYKSRGHTPTHFTFEPTSILSFTLSFLLLQLRL